jgi:uncharacterized metal-binding protein
MEQEKLTMTENRCSGQSVTKADKTNAFEIAEIEKAAFTCDTCEEYSKQQSSKPVAVMSCEGACLRGEVSRQAANIICHKLAPDRTVRICLGGAFTKDTGQRNLVRNASRVISLEGCPVNCASRMMKGVLKGLNPEIVAVNKLYALKKDVFGINELPEDEIRLYADEAARKVAATL